MDEIGAVVELQVDELRHRLSDTDVNLILEAEAKALIAREGYDPVYGARPLKRYIQREVETPLARKIVAGEVASGATVRGHVDKDGLVLEVVGT